MRFAFDVGGTNTDFAVFDDAGEIVTTARERTPVDRWDAFVAMLLARIATAEGVHGRAQSVGVSLAAVIDPASGEGLSANIPHLSGRCLALELSQGLGRHVDVGNDADCFTVAEALAGAGRGQKVVFGIIIGTGTGGGLVVNGQLVRGHSGFTGEWGHGGRLSDDLIRRGLTPQPCGCGVEGCLDPYASARGVERIYRIITGEVLDCPDVMALWKNGDDGAGQSMALYLDLVARQLALLVGILDPDIMPMGGGVAQEPALVEALDRRVRAQMAGKRASPLLVPGVFVEDGCLRGAAMLGPRD
ncbi:MAG: ROK family protein [Alphaproteobacteria bacterium]